ncbi:glycosyltransferase family 4 protein [Ochrobactrum pseudogrignonense]|nr:glycosyltransferase family 4 protein [Brucella pseudogrignonensis]
MEEFGLTMLATEKLLMTRSDAVRANSRAIVTEIENAYEFKFNPDGILVIPHGLSEVSLQHGFIQNEDRNHIEILFVGRLEARKGIDILLSSLQGILENNSDICVRIIGDNSLLNCDHKTYMEQFTQAYQNYSWFDQVVFEGKVTEDSLIEAYQSCDIFVAPSRFESFGLIFLEAMRAGKPVIGTNVGGIPEIVIDKLNGYLIETNNVIMLTEALQTLIDNKDLRQTMGSAGREIYESRFTADKMAVASIGLYRMAISRKEEEQ